MLCEAEDSWIDRLRRVLQPDLISTPGRYADLGDAELAAARPTPDLLAEFATLRSENVARLEGLGLSSDDLQAERLRRDGRTESVDNLLATWIAHDLYHLGQIFKSYSALYVDRIGPYQAYLNLPHFN